MVMLVGLLEKVELVEIEAHLSVSAEELEQY